VYISLWVGVLLEVTRSTHIALLQVYLQIHISICRCTSRYTDSWMLWNIEYCPWVIGGHRFIGMSKGWLCIFFASSNLMNLQHMLLTPHMFVKHTHYCSNILWCKNDKSCDFFFTHLKMIAKVSGVGVLLPPKGLSTGTF